MSAVEEWKYRRRSVFQDQHQCDLNLGDSAIAELEAALEEAEDGRDAMIAIAEQAEAERDTLMKRIWRRDEKAEGHEAKRDALREIERFARMAAYGDGDESWEGWLMLRDALDARQPREGGEL